MPVFIDSNISKDAYNQSGWILVAMMCIVLITNIVSIFFSLIFDLGRFIARLVLARLAKKREEKKRKDKLREERKKKK